MENNVHSLFLSRLAYRKDESFSYYLYKLDRLFLASRYSLDDIYADYLDQHQSGTFPHTEEGFSNLYNFIIGREEYKEFIFSLGLTNKEAIQNLLYYEKDKAFDIKESFTILKENESSLFFLGADFLYEEKFKIKYYLALLEENVNLHYINVNLHYIETTLNENKEKILYSIGKTENETRNNLISKMINYYDNHNNIYSPYIGHNFVTADKVTIFYQNKWKNTSIGLMDGKIAFINFLFREDFSEKSHLIKEKNIKHYFQIYDKIIFSLKEKQRLFSVFSLKILDNKENEKIIKSLKILNKASSSSGFISMLQKRRKEKAKIFLDKVLDEEDNSLRFYGKMIAIYSNQENKEDDKIGHFNKINEEEKKEIICKL